MVDQLGPAIPLCFLYFKMTSHGPLGWGSEEDSFPAGQSSVSLKFSPAKESFQLDWFKKNGLKWSIQFQCCLSMQAKTMQRKCAIRVSPFLICKPSCMLHSFGIELKAGFCGFIRKSQTDMDDIIWGYFFFLAFSKHCFVLGLFWGCGLLIKEGHVSNLFTVHSPAGRGEQSKG